jgi:hypothetical protein
MNRQQLLNIINQNLPDNTSRQITPYKIREIFGNYLNAYYNKEDDQLSGVVDLNDFFTKLQLQTAGQSQVHWDNITNVPDLAGDILTGNTILWVSKAGNDTTGQKGKFNLPYLTIQKAVNESVSGDTIFVLPGEYSENVASVKANCRVVFLGITLNGNIENTTGATGVVFDFSNSVINGVPNANNNTLTGKILLKNTAINIGSGTLGGNVGLNLFGDGYSTINASGGTVGNTNGNTIVSGVKIQTATILLYSGEYKNCEFSNCEIKLSESNTTNFINCKISTTGDAFTFIGGNSKMGNIEYCTIIGNKLYDNGRTLNIDNIKKTSLILANNTANGGGAIKMIACDVNLSKASFGGNATITDYFTQFNY